MPTNPSVRNPRTGGGAYLVALAALLAFGSCQDKGTQSDPGPIAISAVTPYADPWKMPDSVTWGVGLAPQQPVDSRTITETSITARFSLSSPTTDTIKVGLWLGGVRFAFVPFTEDGITATVFQHAPVFDTVAKALIRTCSTKTDRNRDTLLARYARGLADGIPGYRGFPANCPVGMDTASILRMALAWAVGKGVPLQGLVRTWSLPLDTLGVRGLAPELLALGLVTEAQLAKALPPYPVRLTTSVTLLAAPVPGGDGVGLAGVFAWEGGRTVKPGFQVRTAEGIDRTNFHILDSRTGMRVDTARIIFPGDTTWSLKDAFTMQVDSSARMGQDTLVVSVADNDGHAATGRAVFRVTRPTAPKLVVTSSIDTTVPNSTGKIWMSAAVTDSFGPIAFKIQSRSVSGPPYGDSVLLEVGTNTVSFEVCNQAKLCAHKTARVVRAAAPGDQVPPVVGKVNAPRDTMVPYETRTMDLSWSVLDDSLLATVSLDGVPLTGASALYKTVVRLRVGLDTFVLLALDGHGNARRDTVVAVRGADTTKPVIRRSLGTNDTTLPPVTGSFPVSWSVVDNALKSVTLDGATIHSTSGIYSSIVVLAGRSVWIGISAIDSSGNVAKDSIFVELKDHQGPTIARISPAADTTVDNTATSVRIKLSVTDASGVDSVKIDGMRVDSISGGIYAAQVDFASYAQDRSVRVVAWDHAGNLTESVIVIHRRDPVVVTAPSATLVQPASRKGVALAADIDSIVVKWRVSSLLRLSDTAVRIQGELAVRDSGSVWSAKVGIPGTGQEYAILMVATDTSGRATTDTVWVTRAVPRITLGVVFDTTKGDPVLRQGVWATMLDSVLIPWRVDGICQGCAYRADGAEAGISGAIVSSGAKLSHGESSHELVVSVAGVVVARNVVKIRRYGAMTLKTLDGDRDTVGHSDSTGAAVWSVTGAVSVAIDGIGQNPSVTGIYSRTLTGLRQGANASTLTAIDSLGRMQTSIAGIYRLLEADLLFTPSRDSTWDSAVYKIASVTPGATLSWSTDSLSWKPAPANGTVVVYRSGRVYAKSACQGYSTNIARSDSITILHTNTAPAFRRLAKDTIRLLEDAAAFRLLWCDSASTGGQWDSAQKLRYVLNPVGSASSFFEVKPTIDSVTGILAFKLAKDAFGTVKFRVVLKDDGGVGNQGVDSSRAEELVLVITGVNDPMPFGIASLTIGAVTGESKVYRDSAADDFFHFGSGGGGSGNWVEAQATPSFLIVPQNTDAKECFDTLPTVKTRYYVIGRSDLVQYYTIEFHSIRGCGTSGTFNLVVHDGGGTANGGSDSSMIPLTINLDNRVQGSGGNVYHCKRMGNLAWLTENIGGACPGCYAAGSALNSYQATTACPTGWRLPSPSEWQSLFSWSGGLEHLRAGGGWHEDRLVVDSYYGTITSVATPWPSDNSTGFGMLSTEQTGSEQSYPLTQFYTSDMGGNDPASGPYPGLLVLIGPYVNDWGLVSMGIPGPASSTYVRCVR